MKLAVEFKDVSLIDCPLTEVMKRNINKASYKLKMLSLWAFLLKSISDQIKLYKILGLELLNIFCHSDKNDKNIKNLPKISLLRALSIFYLPKNILEFYQLNYSF